MRFLQDQFLVGTTGVFFNDKNEVLLLKHTYREISWSLPGGYLKAGEHPEEGLEREIKEESGLVVSADRQFKTQTDRDSARLDISFVGKFIGGEFKRSKEVSDFGFFSFDNLPIIMPKQLYLIQQILEHKP